MTSSSNVMWCLSTITQCGDGTTVQVLHVKLLKLRQQTQHLNGLRSTCAEM